MAGKWYPADPEQLRSAIESVTPEVEKKERVRGALCPHAGFAFSGRVAGELFATIEVPDSVVLLNPSHSFDQPAFALWTGGSWQTPLGEAMVHEALTSALSEVPLTVSDDRPHLEEWSAEAVVPFLQYHNPQMRMAVVCVTQSARLAALKEFGTALAQVLADCGEQGALIVASSDLSHEGQSGALQIVDRNDPLAIAQMEQLSPEGLYRVCLEQGVTMCGVRPAAAMIAAVMARGGKEGVLVSRATSSDSPLGTDDYVVGYAGMMFR